MGRGMGGVWPAPTGLSGMAGGDLGRQSSGSEVETLKAQAEALGSQLEQIKQRIDQLEKGGSK